MRINRKKIMLIALGILITLLAVWRLWPHSLQKVISVDTDEVTTLACNATISRSETDGTPFIDSYDLQALLKHDEHFDKILNMLSTSKYQQDFRNLLPRPITAVSADGYYDGKAAAVFLAWGSAEHEKCYLSFAGNSVIVSTGDDNGLLIYHLTNPDMLDKLVEYMQIANTTS